MKKTISRKGNKRKRRKVSHVKENRERRMRLDAAQGCVVYGKFPSGVRFELQVSGLS